MEIRKRQSEVRRVEFRRNDLFVETAEIGNRKQEIGKTYCPLPISVVKSPVRGDLFVGLLVSMFPYFLISCLYCELATITGDKMKILQKGDILEFIGNVKLVQQNVTVCANEMRSDEKTGIVDGNGNITVCYSSGTENIFAYGDVAKYNKNNGSGIFTGNVSAKRVLSQNTTDAINLTCEELEVFDFGCRFHAIGNVDVKQSYMVATSSEAFYDRKTKEVLLLGGPPKITRNDDKEYSEYSGDRITIATDDQTLTILGNVKTKMVGKKNGNKN